LKGVVLAHIAADAGVELLLARDQGEQLTADGPPVMAVVDALVRLDAGWCRFIHDGQGDAEAVVTEALTRAAGEIVMLWTMASLEQIREHQRVVTSELYPDA
jgi:hypothetical protein